jgi:hypothetical protein
MNRITFLSGLLMATVLTVSCQPAPGGGGGTPAPGGVDGDTARAALCDTGSQTSLANLATELEAMTDETDTTQITTAIGTTMADLQSAQLEGGQAVARDAAVTALGQLQTAISDPNTRGQAATQAAAALRTANTEIC